MLEVRHVRKRFGGTQALHDLDLDVRTGEIHAFLGANGAGKSTLIRILAGVHVADEGEILFKGQPVQGSDLRNHISIVHQDLGLIPTMTVGENMALSSGYPRRTSGLIDWPAVDRKAATLLAELGTTLPLDRVVSRLSQAERSIVAIARALSRNVDLLILDEPTASLPEADVDRLFDVLERLRRRGVAVIYVTHRLDEVFRLADAATVIRDGRTVVVHRPLAISSEQLVSEIVGLGLGQHVTRRATATATAPVRLALEAGCADGAGPVDLLLRDGEVVGLAGLRGQGHEAIGRALAGALPLTGGTLTIEGRPVSFANPAAAIRAGVGFATGRRAEEGVAGVLSVQENLFLNPLNFGKSALSFRRDAEERREAAGVLAHFQVKPADPSRLISTLSGGNQQKVVLARLAGQNYKVVVLEDPTIGVDIGVKSEIYRLMREDAASGTLYVVVSSDFEELAAVCDRVLAFSRGHVVAELAGDSLTVEAVTHAVSGGLETKQ